MSSTLQKSHKPLPGEKMVSIWEDTKDLGLLVGKGGLFGNVCVQNFYFDI